MAAEWIQANDPSVLTHHLDDWWQVFRDPTLDELIVMAYEQNPNLRIAGTRVLEARAGQAIASANIFPQSQQAIGSYARVNLNPNLPLIGPLIDAGPAGRSPFAFNNWLYGFNLSWEMDLWGRIRRNIESTNASLDASVEDYDAALVTLLADVASNYIQYRIAQQRIKIRSTTSGSRRASCARRTAIQSRNHDQARLEQARTVLEQTRSTIPAFEITLGRANGYPLHALGHASAQPSGRARPGPATGQQPDAKHAGMGRHRHPSRSTAPAAGCPKRRTSGGGGALRSVWPRPHCIRRSRSTA